MKSDECDMNKIIDIGFIDPKRVNGKLLLQYPKETEANLLRYLQRQGYKNSILLPYNFG